jgi:hypothetical protein
MDRDTIEQLAQRAAEDGEHAIVAECQVLLSSCSSDEDKRSARKAVRAYRDELSR